MLQHGPASLWGGEGDAHGGMLEGEGLLRNNQPQDRLFSSCVQLVE